MFPKPQTALLLSFLLAGATSVAGQQPPPDPKYRITPTVDSTFPRGIYIPESLEDAFRELDRMLTPAFIAEFRASEDQPILYHHGFGTWLRNNWGLWAGSRLAKYFNCLGIFHPDDMSGIILTSYWRHLNGRPLALQDQIAQHHRYWLAQGTDSAKLRPLCERGRPN